MSCQIGWSYTPASQRLTPDPTRSSDQVEAAPSDRVWGSIFRSAVVALVVTFGVVLVTTAGAAAETTVGDSPPAANVQEDVDELTGCENGVCGERVENPESSYHSSVVRLSVNAPDWVDNDIDQGVGGTGVLIEPGVVITAAHTVTYDEDLGTSDQGEFTTVEDISVIPAQDAESKPFGEISVEQVYLDDDWAGGGNLPVDDKKYADFAVLRLEEPVGRETGTFDVKPAADVVPEGDTFTGVALTGYPVVRDFSVDAPQNTMWEDTGSVERIVVERLIEKDDEYLDAGVVGEDEGSIEAYAGFSGGPAYYVDDGTPTSIGVLHGPGPNPDTHTQITSIKQKHLDMIEEAKQDWPDAEVSVEDVTLPSSVDEGEEFRAQVHLKQETDHEQATASVEKHDSIHQGLDCDTSDFRDYGVDGERTVFIDCTAEEGISVATFGVIVDDYTGFETVPIDRELDSRSGISLTYVRTPDSATAGGTYNMKARFRDYSDGEIDPYVDVYWGADHCSEATLSWDTYPRGELETSCEVAEDAAGVKQFEVFGDFDIDARVDIESNPDHWPKATLSAPESVEAGSEFAVDVDLRNDALQSQSATFQLDHDAGECERSSFSVNLEPDEHRTVEITCSVDQPDYLQYNTRLSLTSSASEVGDEVVIEVRDPSFDVALEGVPSPVNLNDEFTFNIQVTESQGYRGELSLDVELEHGECTPDQWADELSADEERTIPVSCTVTEPMPGGGIIELQVRSPDDEVNVTDRTVMDIADISTDIDNDSDIIASPPQPGEEFDVSLTVANKGGQPDTIELSVTLEEGSCDLDSKEISLSPQDELNTTATCTPDTDASGLTIVVIEDYLDDTDPRRSKYIRVLDDSPDGVSVELDDVHNPVMPNATELTVAGNVTNSAESEVTDDIDVKIDGEVVDTADLTLAGGESETISRTVPVEPNEGASLDIGVESSSEDDSLTVSVAEQFEGVVADEYEPLPGGSDGLYRDFNGDGDVSNGDVTDFFSAQHVIVEENEPYFDYNGDGTVSQADVVELFEYVSG